MELVVEEYTLEEDLTIVFKKGETYTHFVDPETGLFYRPIDGFTVTGEGLIAEGTGLFVQITDADNFIDNPNKEDTAE